jgi:hypothetical protein
VASKDRTAAQRRRIVVTHTRSLTFDQAEVDAVWNSGVLPIPDYILAGDEDTDPDERAIAVYTALDGSLLELFLEVQDDDVGYEVEDYDPEA